MKTKGRLMAALIVVLARLAAAATARLKADGSKPV